MGGATSGMADLECALLPPWLVSKRIPYAVHCIDVRNNESGRYSAHKTSHLTVPCRDSKRHLGLSLPSSPGWGGVRRALVLIRWASSRPHQEPGGITVCFREKGARGAGQTIGKWRVGVGSGGKWQVETREWKVEGGHSEMASTARRGITRHSTHTGSTVFKDHAETQQAGYFPSNKLGACRVRERIGQVWFRWLSARSPDLDLGPKMPPYVIIFWGERLAREWSKLPRQPRGLVSRKSELIRL